MNQLYRVLWIIAVHVFIFAMLYTMAGCTVHVHNDPIVVRRAATHKRVVSCYGCWARSQPRRVIVHQRPTVRPVRPVRRVHRRAARPRRRNR